MWTCPKCTCHKKNGRVCQRCGYDESRDPIRLRTLVPVAGWDMEQLKGFYLKEEQKKMQPVPEKTGVVEPKPERIPVPKPAEKPDNKPDKKKKSEPVFFTPGTLGGKKVYTIGMLQMEEPQKDVITESFIRSLQENLQRKGAKNAVPELKFLYDKKGSYKRKVPETFAGAEMIFYNGMKSPYVLDDVISGYQGRPITVVSTDHYYSSCLMERKMAGYSYYHQVMGTMSIPSPEDLAELLISLYPSKNTRTGVLYHPAAEVIYQKNRFSAWMEYKGYKVKEYCVTDYFRQEDAVKQAAQNADVLFLPSSEKWNTKLIDAVRSCGIPVIAGDERICRKCGVVTLQANLPDLGKKAGRIAAEYLMGDKNAIGVLDNGDKYSRQYNEELCGHYGINQKKKTMSGFMAADTTLI